MSKDKTEFDLNMHTFRLLQQDPFFAALSRRIHKSPTKSIPTAGVCINPQTAQFEMVYNPEFMGKLTDVEVLGVLKHEMYHIIFEHVTGRLPAEGMNMQWNVATDLAINSHLIGELPEGGCIPSKVGTPFEGYPVGLSAEAYYEMIKNDEQFKQEPEQGEGDGEGDGDGQGDGQGDNQEGDGQQGQSKGKGKPSLKDYNMDDHGGWGEASEEAKAMAKERLKDAVEKAAKEASAKGWGSVSAKIRKQIMDMITAKVDWRKVLRYFIKQSQRADKRSTVRRLNKRFPYIHAGKKIRRQANIAISIDQSGSVSDQMLAAFFAELNSLAKFATFTVIPFDSAIDETLIYEWRKGERRAWERVMHGGTDFNAPTEYVNKHGFDGMVVLTDMEAPKPKPCKCQRIWFTDSRGKQNPYFQTNERVIAIDTP